MTDTNEAPQTREQTPSEKRIVKVRPDHRDLTIYEDLLKEFNKNPRRKRSPYVLFGYVGKEARANNPGFEARIFKLPVGTIHGTANDLDRYVDRGFVILDYWFPTADEVPQPQRRGDLVVGHGWAHEWSTREAQDRMRALKSKVLRLKGEAGALYDEKKRAETAEAEANELRERMAEIQKRMKDKK